MIPVWLVITMYVWGWSAFFVFGYIWYEEITGGFDDTDAPWLSEDEYWLEKKQ